jgi:hypothetical protein
MFVKVAREGGRFRFTLSEMLVGIVLLAIPLAYWASNVRGFQYRPLSPSSQKRLAANPWMALPIQKQNDAKNSNALVAYKITAYAIMALNALIFAVFLMIRRFGCSWWRLVNDPDGSSQARLSIRRSHWGPDDA